MSVAEQAAGGVGGAGGIVASTAGAPPWARLWARVFDLQLNGAVVTIGAGLAAPTLLFAIDRAPGGQTFDILALAPLVLLMDAVVQATFGQTPGKAIAGVRVELVEGGRPGWLVVLKRDALVYFKGLWLGLPVLTIVGVGLAYARVSSGRPTSWDRAAGTRVIDTGVTIWRTVLTAILAVGVDFLALGVAYLIARGRAAG